MEIIDAQIHEPQPPSPVDPNLGELSQAEKEMIFSGTIRRVLRWPKAD